LPIKRLQQAVDAYRDRCQRASDERQARDEARAEAIEAEAWRIADSISRTDWERAYSFVERGDTPPLHEIRLESGKTVERAQFDASLFALIDPRNGLAHVAAAIVEAIARTPEVRDLAERRIGL
jgi:hypothetical protein